jgi:hypothetical protein
VDPAVSAEVRRVTTACPEADDLLVVEYFAHWGTLRSPAKLAAELEEKLSRYPNPRHATLQRRLFTRARVRGTKSSDPSVRWHCLEDLYRLPP